MHDRKMDLLALSGMIKQVVRCSVCMKVHDITELVDRQQSLNGSCTFICPQKKTSGSYRLENVGTLKMAAPEAVPAVPVL